MEVSQHPNLDDVQGIQSKKKGPRKEQWGDTVSNCQSGVGVLDKSDP